jgi:signal transduction histidine kinase
MKIVWLETGKKTEPHVFEQLTAKGVAVNVTPTLQDCLAEFVAGAEDPVVLDLDLYKKGIEAMQQIRAVSPASPIIALASLEKLPAAEEALKQGAWDFIIKQPDYSHLQEIPRALARCAELKRLKGERDRYRQEAIELKAALEKGGEENRAEESAVADFAENLKAPLTAVLGYLEIIASSLDDSSARSSHAVAVKRIEALVKRLIDMIVSFAEAAALKENAVPLHKNILGVNQIVGAAVEARKNEADFKNVEIAVELADETLAFCVDPVRLERAIGLILSNAIQLSPLGGSVTVVPRLRRDGVAIAITDGGSGISPAERPLLFDPKKKIRRPSGDIDTVGLYVAQRIVAAHGGAIEVESDPLEGTTMTIVVPSESATDPVVTT